MQAQGIETAMDRVEAQTPMCKFGKTGVCCRHCHMGPCRITSKADCGVCGADANTIAARGFVRTVAAGTAAHSDHGRAVAELLISTAKGEAQGYSIKDPAKLRFVAEWFGLSPEGKSVEDLAQEVGQAALAEFGKSEGTQLLLKRAPEPRQKMWADQGIEPRAIDREVTECMHRTGMGSDQDYKNLIKQASRCSLSDGWGGSMIATELQDVLFGTPSPLKGELNLGVLQDDEVNILVHGHEPELSEMVAVACQDPELLAKAQAAGAKGITLAGICCTANELLVRHGIPIAGNMSMQEYAVATGAVEVLVVDIQCIMQGHAEMSGKFHTKLITTSPRAKIDGVEHVEFHHDKALDTAKQIVEMAIENYPNRKSDDVRIPDAKSEAIVGFSHEAIVEMLGGRFRGSYQPLNDNIINGRIRGVAGVVGCVNVRKGLGTDAYVTLVKELISRDVLVVQTGCAAIQCAMSGLQLPEMMEAAGPGLREVCETVGMPPVLHSGACVDNSRILIALTEIVKTGGLGEDIADVPAAGVCLEWMHEKAIAIGQYFVASGAYTVFGMESPVIGAPDVHAYLTDGIESELGGKWAFEPDFDKIADLVVDHIERKRDALGINAEQERKLYDMEDRRQLAIE